jgi:outer membrane protein assembly factor BamD
VLQESAGITGNSGCGAVEVVVLDTRKYLLVSLCVGLCLTVACASGPEKKKLVSYRTSAKENFIKGKKAYDDEDFAGALQFFKFVKSKFPYSKFAIQADLYTADCYFGQEKYLEAADSYLSFIKLHPRNEKMPYAMFRIGVCYFKRIPDDWFITPPAYELDQAETLKAIREIKRYLQSFPNHENAPEARDLLKQCLVRMAEQTRYVMEFYRKRGHFRGVLWRAEQILSAYSGVGFDEQALYYKAEAQVKLKQLKGAKSSLHEMLTRFPKGDYSDDAKELLANLTKHEDKKVGSTKK